eukprot:11626367-Ditylum_brightwellii.AAC.1
MMTMIPPHFEFDDAALPHHSNYDDDASTASSASFNDDENVPPKHPPAQKRMSMRWCTTLQAQLVHSKKCHE